MLAIFENVAAVGVRRYARIVHQMNGDDGVQNEQHHKRQEKEHGHAADKIEGRPKRIDQGEANANYRTVIVFTVSVFGNP